jgi:hypothetical protein
MTPLSVTPQGVADYQSRINVVTAAHGFAAGVNVAEAEDGTRTYSCGKCAAPIAKSPAGLWAHGGASAVDMIAAERHLSAVPSPEAAPPSSEPDATILSRDEAAVALAEVEDAIEAIQERLRPAIAWRDALKAHIVSMCAAENATVALVGEYSITRIDPKPVVDRRVDVLRELYTLADEGVLPRALVEKAVFVEQPPPTWKVNLTFLKPLAKYGDRVASILARGLVPTVTGSPRWEFSRNRPQRDVTPGNPA